MLHLVAATGLAQFPEDALRFATPGFGVGARSLGMGNAYTGIASDYSALFWNPAGLAQIEHGEFSLGLSHLNGMDKSNFFGNRLSYNNNATALNTLGFVFPAPVQRGSLVLGFGFSRQSDFTTGVSFERVNPGISLIQTFAADSGAAPPDPAGNIAYELFLADTANGMWISPVVNRLKEMEKVLEGGGLNNWSAGAGIDIAKDISAGATLTYLSGSYTYDGNYTERDAANIYSTGLYDFDRFVIDNSIRSDISGVNAKVGIMFRRPGRYRVGFAIKTPTVFHVTEDFSTSYRSYFDNGDQFGPIEDAGSDEYDVTTPWVFSGGASFTVSDLLLSGDVEYTDWTELEFSKATPAVLAYNKEIKDRFRGTANLRAGAEYDIRNLGLRVRGGFMYTPSPYRGDPASFARKFATAGLGILLGESTMVDVAYARGWWKTVKDNYDHSATTNEDISTNHFLMTFSYRFWPAVCKNTLYSIY